MAIFEPNDDKDRKGDNDYYKKKNIKPQVAGHNAGYLFVMYK